MTELSNFDSLYDLVTFINYDSDPIHIRLGDLRNTLISLMSKMSNLIFCGDNFSIYIIKINNYASMFNFICKELYDTYDIEFYIDIKDLVPFLHHLSTIFVSITCSYGVLAKHVMKGLGYLKQFIERYIVITPYTLEYANKFATSKI